MTKRAKTTPGSTAGSFAPDVKSEPVGVDLEPPHPAADYSRIVKRLYDQSPDYAKEKLAQFLAELPSFDDEHFVAITTMAIHDSAMANSFRGNWNHDHCRADACSEEAARRHVAAGHDPACRGDNLYRKAYRKASSGVFRSQPIAACNCGHDRPPLDPGLVAVQDLRAGDRIMSSPGKNDEVTFVYLDPRSKDVTVHLESGGEICSRAGDRITLVERQPVVDAPGIEGA